MSQASAKEKPLEVVSNSKALLKDIQNAAEKVEDFKKQRQSINAKIKAIREDLEAKGIDKKAFDDVMRYFSANLAGRDGYETSRQMVHEALAEIQDDLFDHNKDKDQD